MPGSTIKSPSTSAIMAGFVLITGVCLVVYQILNRMTSVEFREDTTQDGCVNDRDQSAPAAHGDGLDDVKPGIHITATSPVAAKASNVIKPKQMTGCMHVIDCEPDLQLGSSGNESLGGAYQTYDNVVLNGDCVTSLYGNRSSITREFTAVQSRDHLGLHCLDSLASSVNENNDVITRQGCAGTVVSNESHNIAPAKHDETKKVESDVGFNEYESHWKLAHKNKNQKHEAKQVQPISYPGGATGDKHTSLCSRSDMKRRHAEPINIVPVQCLSFRNISKDLFMTSTPLCEEVVQANLYKRRGSLGGCSGDLTGHNSISYDAENCVSSPGSTFSAECDRWTDTDQYPVQLISVAENPIELYAYRCYTLEISSSVDISEPKVRAVLLDMQQSHPLLRMRKTHAGNFNGNSELQNPTIDLEYIKLDLSCNSIWTKPDNKLISSNENIWKVKALVSRTVGDSYQTAKQFVFYFMFYGNIIKPKNCKRLSEEFVRRLNLHVADKTHACYRRHLLLPLGVMASDKM